MAVKQESKPRTRIMVWIDKQTRCDINKLMERDDIPDQAAAIALAARIAVRYLYEQNEEGRG